MKVILAVLSMIAAVAVGAGIFFGLTRTDVAKIQNITIQGATAETTARLKALVTAQVGESIWRVDVQKETARLATDPWVETVEVRRRFPHEVIIEVREREAFAVVGDRKGKFMWVDAKGHLLTQAPTKHLAKQPVLLGERLVSVPELRLQGVEILKALPLEGRLSLKDTSEVRYDDQHGFLLTLQKPKLQVELGKEDLALKLDRARRVAEYIEQHGINASRIDADYGKKVLVKVQSSR